MPRELPELREIPGWEGLYAVTSDGRVRALSRVVKARDGRMWVKRARWMKTWRNYFGYRVVSLTKAKARAHIFVHRLVAAAWMDAPPPGRDRINHMDSNPANNNVGNLEWSNAGHNTKHSWDAGRRTITPAMRKGFSKGHAARRSMSYEQAAQIRKRVKKGERQSDLAREYGALPSTVCMIVSGKIYSTPKRERTSP